MQDTDLVIRHRIIPGSAGIDINLDLVDQGGTVDPVPLFHHKKISALQSGLRSGTHRVDIPKPASGNHTGFFRVMDFLIDFLYTGKIKNHRSTDFHISHSILLADISADDFTDIP